MILTIIKMHGRPTKRREILQTIMELSSKTMREKGCVNASYFEDITNRDIHYIFEKWETRKDLERYKGSTAYNVLLGLDALLEEPLQIQHTFECSSEKKSFKERHNGSDLCQQSICTEGLFFVSHKQQKRGGRT